MKRNLYLISQMNTKNNFLICFGIISIFLIAGFLFLSAQEESFIDYTAQYNIPDIEKLEGQNVQIQQDTSTGALTISGTQMNSVIRIDGVEYLLSQQDEFLKINSATGNIDEGKWEVPYRYDYGTYSFGNNQNLGDIPSGSKISFSKEKGEFFLKLASPGEYPSTELKVNNVDFEKGFEFSFERQRGKFPKEIKFNIKENQGPATMEFLGGKFFLPEDSQFSMKNGITNFPEGTMIEKMPEPNQPTNIPIGEYINGIWSQKGTLNAQMLIQGKNIALPNGYVLEQGTLAFNNGEIFVPSASEAQLNSGLIIRPMGTRGVSNSDTYIFTSKAKTADYINVNYVVAEENQLYINGQADPFEIQLNEKNKYIQMKPDDYLAFTNGGSSKGKITITKQNEAYLPTIEIEGSPNIHTDSARFDVLEKGGEKFLRVKETENLGGAASFAAIHDLGKGKQIRSFSLPGKGIYFDPVSGGEAVFYTKSHEKLETELLAISKPDLERYFPDGMRLIDNPANLASNQKYLSDLKDYSGSGKRAESFLKQIIPQYESLYGGRFGAAQGRVILWETSQIYFEFETHKDPQVLTQDIQTYTQSLREQGILNPEEDLPNIDISRFPKYDQFRNDLKVLESIGKNFVEQGFMDNSELAPLAGADDPDAKLYGVRYYNFEFNKPTSTNTYKANLGQY